MRVETDVIDIKWKKCTELINTSTCENEMRENSKASRKKNQLNMGAIVHVE